MRSSWVLCKLGHGDIVVPVVHRVIDHEAIPAPQRAPAVLLQLEHVGRHGAGGAVRVDLGLRGEHVPADDVQHLGPGDAGGVLAPAVLRTQLLGEQVDAAGPEDAAQARQVVVREVVVAGDRHHDVDRPRHRLHRADVELDPSVADPLPRHVDQILPRVLHHDLGRGPAIRGASGWRRRRGSRAPDPRGAREAANPRAQRLQQGVDGLADVRVPIHDLPIILVHLVTTLVDGLHVNATSAGVDSSHDPLRLSLRHGDPPHPRDAEGLAGSRGGRRCLRGGPDGPTPRGGDRRSPRLPAALFCPSGTMGNQICLRLHARSGMEVIAESRSHVFTFEMGALASLSGLMPRPVEAPRGVLDRDRVGQADPARPLVPGAHRG